MNMILAVSVVSFTAYFFSFLSASVPADDPQFKYVGVTTCVSACHKSEAQGSQFPIWQASKHSQAYQTLKSAAADEIAKSKGFTTAAAETPECLKCHVLGKELNPAQFEETFSIENGVQCETCHGPGSEYKKLSVMKDKVKNREMGMERHTEGEPFCVTCHNSDSPTFKGFNYEEAWAQIKHLKPVQ